jgi:predicted sulfurtransferase
LLAAYLCRNVYGGDILEYLPQTSKEKAPYRGFSFVFYFQTHRIAHKRDAKPLSFCNFASFHAACANVGFAHVTLSVNDFNLLNIWTEYTVAYTV